MLVAAQNRFAFRLFAEAVRDAGAGNCVVSPLGVSSALEMLWNGTGGDTRKEMTAVLPSRFRTAEQVGSGYAAILRQIQQQSDGGATVHVANALWIDKDHRFAQKYTDWADRFYSANAAALDFRKAGAAEKINGWVRKETGGKIGGIVTSEELSDPTIIAILTNAVYFKGTWYEPFFKEATKEEPFSLADGSTKIVPLMKREEMAAYYHGDGVEITSLHYQGSATLHLVLPERDGRLADLLPSLTPERWQKWKSQLKVFERTLFLPRFTVRHDANLKGVLSQLGVRSAFEMHKADLTPMGLEPGAFISKAKHKTYLRIDEEGTEAAAATALFAAAGGLPPPMEKVTFRADRPFLAVIEENNTGAILFMAPIQAPVPDE